jgi:16S rRNA G1207 methylase RsmC
VTPEEAMREHEALHPLRWRVGDAEVALTTKVGVPGAPGLDPALAPLAEALTRGRAALRDVPLLDATGGCGAVAALARSQGVPAQVLVRSAAARRVALAGGADEDALIDGFSWDLPTASVKEAWWRPATDLGLARLEAELAGWGRALHPDGVVWAVWHKDQGGKRAERLAATRFARVDVVTRSAGWRVVALRGPRLDAPAPEPWVRWEGPDGATRSVVGTFSASGLDPGTELLLAALEAAGGERLAGARVLDLGCGTGVLARRAQTRGAAEVHALDDDLAAVRSTRAALAGRPASVHWSDLAAQVPAVRVLDVVLMNPPFHVGRQVVGALSRAFVAAGLAALRPGGQLWLVANVALPYERDLARWAQWRNATPPGATRFKVLTARPP